MANKYTLDTKINDLIFPKGCETIHSALKRTGCDTLGEVIDYMKTQKIPRVGSIRIRLIRGWFLHEVGVDIFERRRNEYMGV